MYVLSWLQPAIVEHVCFSWLQSAIAEHVCVFLTSVCHCWACMCFLAYSLPFLSMYVFFLPTAWRCWSCTSGTGLLLRPASGSRVREEAQRRRQRVPEHKSVLTPFTLQLPTKVSSILSLLHISYLAVFCLFHIISSGFPQITKFTSNIYFTCHQILINKNMYVYIYFFNILKIDKRNNLTNIYTKQYQNMAAIFSPCRRNMVAACRLRRHAELNSQASTQGCNTLRLTYVHSHRDSTILYCVPSLRFAEKSQQEYTVHVFRSLLHYPGNLLFSIHAGTGLTKERTSI